MKYRNSEGGYKLFQRKCVLRRKLVNNMPLLCETDSPPSTRLLVTLWINLFVEALDELSCKGNSA